MPGKDFALLQREQKGILAKRQKSSVFTFLEESFYLITLDCIYDGGLLLFFKYSRTEYEQKKTKQKFGAFQSRYISVLPPSDLRAVV